MCFAPSHVTGLSRWNWDGDVIVLYIVVGVGQYALKGSKKQFLKTALEKTALRLQQLHEA